MNKPLLYIVVAFLISAGLASFFLQRSSPPDQPEDPQAQEALRLVQTHSAREAPTIQEGIAKIVETMKAKGKSIRVGEWRVAKEPAGTYVVSILIREKGFTEWIERDFAWRVNLKDQSIRIITLPATHLMPFHELPPLPMAPENM